MSDKFSIIINNITQLVSFEGNRAITGKDSLYPKILENACIAIKDDKISYITNSVDDSYKNNCEIYIDAKGKTVTPGYVDCHTHPVFGGTREDEFVMRCLGRSYMEIMESGGGIQSSVNTTRNADIKKLVNDTKKYLDEMLLNGTTTIEAKSGYGLDLDTEIKSLEVLKLLNQSHPIDIIPTFLGAHAVPSEYKSNKEEYIALLINKVLPEIKKLNLAEFCDIFCEKGVFEIEDSRKILQRAKDLGFKLKLHADEIVSLGGAELSAELGAISADHLIAASENGIKQMAEKGIFSVLLPGTSFFLKTKGYANAKLMIESDSKICLATDFNPGSCTIRSIPVAQSIACIYYGITPAQALLYTTLNPACCLGRGNETGSIEKGKYADILIHDTQNYIQIPYHFAQNRIETVIKKGKIVS